MPRNRTNSDSSNSNSNSLTYHNGLNHNNNNNINNINNNKFSCMPPPKTVPTRPYSQQFLPSRSSPPRHSPLSPPSCSTGSDVDEPDSSLHESYPPGNYYPMSKWVLKRINSHNTYLSKQKFTFLRTQEPELDYTDMQLGYSSSPGMNDAGTNINNYMPMSPGVDFRKRWVNKKKLEVFTFKIMSFTSQCLPKQLRQPQSRLKPHWRQWELHVNESRRQLSCFECTRRLHQHAGANWRYELSDIKL